MTRLFEKQYSEQQACSAAQECAGKGEQGRISGHLSFDGQNKTIGRRHTDQSERNRERPTHNYPNQVFDVVSHARHAIAAILLVNLFCPPAFAGWNDGLLTDPNCVAIYNFESGSTFWQDTKSNNNDLAFIRAPALDTTNEQEGTSCADYESASDNVLYLADNALDAGMPGKNGTSNSTFSVCAWVKLESLPTAGDPDWSARTVISKSDATKYSWFARTALNGANTQQELSIGHTGGTAVEPKYNDAINLATGAWYHMLWTFNGSTQAYAMQVTDAGGDVYRATGTTTNAMNIEDARFWVGADNSLAEMDGLLDDVVIFNDVLTYSEANDVRDQTYDIDSDAACVARYRFESGAINVDSKSTNHLGPPFPSATAKQGSASADFERDSTESLVIADSALSAKFPLKNGNGQTSFSWTCWAQFESLSEANNRCPVSKTASTDFVFYGSASYIEYWHGDVGNAAYGHACTTGQWYFIAYTYDAATRAYRFHIWDDTAGTPLGGEGHADLTGTYGFAMDIGTGAFNVGTGFYTGNFDGLIDEVTVWNRVLTTAEITDIREGDYEYTHGTPIHHFRRRR